MDPVVVGVDVLVVTKSKAAAGRSSAHNVTTLRPAQEILAASLPVVLNVDTLCVSVGEGSCGRVRMSG